MAEERKERKQSLMHSLEMLMAKVGILKDVSKLSNVVLQKFNNPHGVNSEELETDNSKKEQKQPDLIEMFDEISLNLDEEIVKIGNNLEELKRIIG